MSNRHIDTPIFAKLAEADGKVELLEGINENLKARNLTFESALREIIRIGHPYSQTRAVAEKCLEGSENRSEPVEPLNSRVTYRCPHCGSEEITGEGVEVGQDAAEQECSCASCGAVWNLIFHLADFEMLEGPDGQDD